MYFEKEKNVVRHFFKKIANRKYGIRLVVELRFEVSASEIY